MNVIFRPLLVFNFISMGHTRPNMFCNTATQVILKPKPILWYLLQQKLYDAYAVHSDGFRTIHTHLS